MIFSSSHSMPATCPVRKPVGCSLRRLPFLCLLRPVLAVGGLLLAGLLLAGLLHAEPDKGAETGSFDTGCPSRTISDIYNATVDIEQPRQYALLTRGASRALVELQKTGNCPADMLLLYQKLGDLFSNAYNPKRDNELAERYYKEAFLTTEKMGVQTIDHFEAASNLAQFYIRTERPNYAEPVYLLCEKILKTQIRPNNPVLYAKLLGSIGGAYLAQGKEEYAFNWYKKSIAELKSTAGASPEATAAVLDDIAASWELYNSRHPASKFKNSVKAIRDTAATLRVRAVKPAS